MGESVDDFGGLANPRAPPAAGPRTGSVGKELLVDTMAHRGRCSLCAPASYQALAKPGREIALSLRGSNRRGHPSVRTAHSTGNYEIGRTLFTPVEIATFRPRMSSSTRTRPESS